MTWAFLVDTPRGRRKVTASTHPTCTFRGSASNQTQCYEPGILWSSTSTVNDSKQSSLSSAFGEGKGAPYLPLSAPMIAETLPHFLAIPFPKPAAKGPHSSIHKQRF